MSKVIKKVAGIGGTLASAATGNPMWAMAGNAIAGSGGKAGQTSAQKTSSGPTMPAWLDTAWQNLYTKANEQYQKPYEAYTGQRVAPLSTDETNAFAQLRDIIGQQNPFYEQAKGTMQDVINRSLNGPTQSQLEQYMNPYQQMVIDVNKENTIRDYDIQRNAMNAQAANAGAFGGSRSYIQGAMADKNLKDLLARLQTEGMQKSWDQAQGLFQQGTANAARGASDLANIAGQNQQSQLTDLSALEGIGAKQRGITQQGLDVGYQDWLDKLNWTNTQNAQMSEMLKNISPNYTGAMQNSTNYGAKPSSDTAMSGLGTLLGGIFGKSGGGSSFSPLGWNTGQSSAIPGGSTFSNNLGWINWNMKDGGKVEDPMKYEENDLYSKNVKEDKTPVERDQPFTKEDMMDYEQNDLYSKNVKEDTTGLEKYMCGGAVKGYASGGAIDFGGWSPYDKPWAKGINISPESISNFFSKLGGGLVGSSATGLAKIIALANAKNQQTQSEIDPVVAESANAIRSLPSTNPNTTMPDGTDAMGLQLPVGKIPANTLIDPTTQPPMDIPAGITPQVPRTAQGQSQADPLQALIDRLTNRTSKGMDREKTAEEEFASNPLIAMGMRMLGSPDAPLMAMSQGYEAYQGAVKGTQAQEEKDLQNLLEMMRVKTSMQNADSSMLYRTAMANKAQADALLSSVGGKDAAKVAAQAAQYFKTLQASRYMDYIGKSPEEVAVIDSQLQLQANKMAADAYQSAQGVTGTGISGEGSAIGTSTKQYSQDVQDSVDAYLKQGKSVDVIKAKLQTLGYNPDDYKF